MCHIFGEQVMITLVTFLCALVLISFKTFMRMVIEDECLFQQPTPWCLLALKHLWEWLLKMSAYFNNQLIRCYFKVSNFF